LTHFTVSNTWANKIHVGASPPNFLAVGEIAPMESAPMMLIAESAVDIGLLELLPLHFHNA